MISPPQQKPRSFRCDEADVLRVVPGLCFRPAIRTDPKLPIEPGVPGRMGVGGLLSLASSGEGTNCNCNCNGGRLSSSALTSSRVD